MIENYIPRSLETVLEKAVNEFPVVIFNWPASVR